jgi:hypothetical protein
MRSTSSSVIISGAVIELGRAPAFVRGHRLRMLQRPAGFHVGRDSGRPEGMTPDLDLQAELCLVPALIAAVGDAAGWRYVEFFTANIRNPNTRRACARACFAWCEARATVKPLGLVESATTASTT